MGRILVCCEHQGHFDNIKGLENDGGHDTSAESEKGC